jgi:hypothetical protein
MLSVRSFASQAGRRKPSALPSSGWTHHDDAGGKSRKVKALAKKRWTPERVRKVTGGRKYSLVPDQHADLLFAMGLLNEDASMSANKLRKYKQINHMASLMEPLLLPLLKEHKTVRMLDVGAGNSFLTILLAHRFGVQWDHPALIVGVERNAKLVESSRRKAEALGLDHILSYLNVDVGSISPAQAFGQAFPNQPDKHGDQAEEQRSEDELKKFQKQTRAHAVFALHACDTATDHAIGFGIQHNADVIAVAPCCQAELAASWRGLAREANSPSAGLQNHAFAPIWQSPNIRRETAAQVTDAMRMLLLRSRGYEVTATEFVESAHSHKNRLITAVRRGSYLHSARAEYLRLKETTGGCGIALEELVLLQEQE